MHNNALKTLSAIFIFMLLLNTKYLALAGEIPNEGGDNELANLQIQEPEEAQMAKRAWKQLQGSWGKRNFDGAVSDEQLQRLIQNYQNDDYVDSPRNFDYPSRFHDYNLISDSDDYDNAAPIEKRAWKSMSNAWGKRDWSKINALRGNGWGKREPGNWNNLRGLWGKRSPQNWNKLSSAWGK